jgi:hypothetical protein
MTTVRRTTTATLSMAALGMLFAPVVSASPTPPTNGGNGAGKSDQCTGSNAERPHSCKSQGGPGNQP